MAGDRDESQQTEEPTQRRLEQAREQGDIVTSGEVTTLILLLGGTLAIAIFARNASHELATLFRTFLAEPDQIAVDPGALQILLGDVMMKLGMIAGPILGFLMLSGVAANLVQHKPTLSFERLKPNLSKLSLLSGFKRMFGIDGLTNLLKGLIKIAIVGLAIWTQLWPERGTLEGMLTQSPAAIADDMNHLWMKLMIASLAAMAVIAGGDFLLQRYQFTKRNRMSKQEVKEEYRQTEGDPMVKGRLRQIRMERAKKRMIAEVPKATVVITNPTHFAVALKYESGKTQAPLCVAKGVDSLALRIREIAKEHQVPIVENPPLARALYATVEVDEAIPVEHFKAVAQVIGYVMKLTGKLRAN
ncbi:flagellar biosynthesis protein FlhB [Rhizomicrobium electricum]|uniref:Flagellar biosynthetic protein FlhB n=1 Tax=Rhizomicrobium electricum TaxID=480070 RepID=A0ABN1EW20_9PROT|nr:flagellar biosynthesis protein FlhB [Rhizomicrobium electricum]NIJ49500.1 flagellar biosynthetic protein FlhB [Rhizomicrobium electricum]